MSNLDAFYHALENPGRYIRQWKKETEKRAIGFFCSYAPEELIHAAGAQPVRIFGSGENMSRADSHIQAYCCSLVRGSLADALSGALDYLDGTVFPHTCDSIQRLSDIWRLNSPIKMHIDVILPVKLNTASSREYMNDVIKKFRRDLENKMGISISDEEIIKSSILYNRIRKALRELYKIKSMNPGAIRGRDLHTAVKAGMVMDRNVYADHLEEYIKELRSAMHGASSDRYKRVFLAGGICNIPDIYSSLEESGGAAVWDELCTGTRYFDGEIKITGDPVDAIAERYMERLICPVKYRSMNERSDSLVRQVREHDAGGVIFLILKYCDPHSFDYPDMKKRLDMEGIPSTLLELEDGRGIDGQIKTRIESFLEML